METQIFYWTGVIIWWLACISVLASVATVAVIAPLGAYKRFRLNWWKWRTAAKFLDLRWTAKEINEAAGRVGGLDDQFLRKAQRLMDAGAKIKRDRQELPRKSQGNNGQGREK